MGNIQNKAKIGRKILAWVLCVCEVVICCSLLLTGCAKQNLQENEEQTYEDLIETSLTYGEYPEQGFRRAEFDKAVAGVEMIDASKLDGVHLSDSKECTIGSINAGSKTLTVESAASFDVGQGIAIANLRRTSNTIVDGKKINENYTWYVDVITAIDGNTITLKTGAPSNRGVIDAVVKHDNYFSFRAIDSYFKNKAHVGFYIPNGVYEVSAVSIFKPPIDETWSYRPDVTDHEDIPGGGGGTLFSFDRKKSINIDFRQSKILIDNGNLHMSHDIIRAGHENVGVGNSPSGYSISTPISFMGIYNSFNVSIKNVTVDGGIKTVTMDTSAYLIGQTHGIEICGVENMILENCEMRYFEMDGIKAAKYKYALLASDYANLREEDYKHIRVENGISYLHTHTTKFTMRNVRLYNNGRDAMSISAGDNFFLDGCEFRNNGFTGVFKGFGGNGFHIESEQDFGYIENFVIRNTIFAENKGVAFSITEHGSPRTTKNVRDKDKATFILDGCLFYASDKISNSRVQSGITDLELTIKNSVFVHSKGASVEMYNYADHHTTRFENNTVLGHFEYNQRNGTTYFSGNKFVLDYESCFRNYYKTHGSNTLPKYAVSKMYFDGDFFYLADRANIETCFNYGSLFRTQDDSAKIGGYNLKDVTILNNSKEGFKFPGFIKPDNVYNGNIYSTYKNVKFFGPILERDDWNIEDFAEFYTTNSRQFSGDFDVLNYKTKVTGSPINGRDLTERKAYDERNYALRLLKKYGLTYAVSYDIPTGSSENPYEISTVGQFLSMNPSKCYKLACDLDFKGAAITPIGYYTGIFDGRGYTLKNINIDLPGQDSVGLFTYLSNGNLYKGIIKNLNIENISVRGKLHVGGLVGLVRGSSAIENCHIFGRGQITGSAYVAGIVGRVYGGHVKINNSSNRVNIKAEGGDALAGGLLGDGYADISNCYAACNIEAAGTFVGGLAACLRKGGSILNSFFNGTINSNGNDVGGIAGIVEGDITISQCYSAGILNAGYRVGGLLGRALNSNVCIYNSYSAIAISGATAIGGLLGVAAVLTTIENCYFAGSLSASANKGGIVGTGTVGIINSYFDNKIGISTPTGQAKTSEQLQDIETYEGWDFNVWSFNANEKKMELKNCGLAV